MNILSRYVMTTIFISVLGVMAVLSGLYIIFTFIAEVGDLGHGTYDSLKAMEYVLLGLPTNIYLMMPVSGLLGSLVGLGLLATHSELVIMRAAGLSIKKIGVGVLSASLILALLTFLLGSFIGPYLQSKADFVRESALEGQDFLWTSQSLWLKDGDNFVYVGKILDNGTLGNIIKYNVQDSVLTSIISAPKAFYKNNHWVLERAEILDYSKLNNLNNLNHSTQAKTTLNSPVITLKKTESLVWSSLAAPTLLATIASNSENLTLLGLVHFVTYQLQNGLDASGYQLKLWRLIFQPLSVMMLMLMALPFVFGPLRSKALGWQLISGLFFGLGFFFVDRFFGPFSQIYHWPPVLGASIPCFIMLIIFTVFSLNLG